jgi:enamine deaminase RidA (YjgF/YER057c/UK114 family)
MKAVFAPTSPGSRLRNMTDSIESVTAAGVSAPAGHYSHATAWNGLVFASGQLEVRAGPRPLQSFRNMDLR